MENIMSGAGYYPVAENDENDRPEEDLRRVNGDGLPGQPIDQ